MIVFGLLACGGPTEVIPPSPLTPPLTDTDVIEDTGDTDLPTPPTVPDVDPCEPGVAELAIGNDFSDGFEAYAPDADFVLDDRRLELLVRADGLAFRDPITTVFRTNLPGGSTTDTVAARVIQCGEDGYGWLSAEVALPDRAEPGDRIELTVSFTDAGGNNAGSTAVGTLR